MWGKKDKTTAGEICLPALGKICEEAAGAHTHRHVEVVILFVGLVRNAHNLQ